MRYCSRSLRVRSRKVAHVTVRVSPLGEFAERHICNPPLDDAVRCASRHGTDGLLVRSEDNVAPIRVSAKMAQNSACGEVPQNHVTKRCREHIASVLTDADPAPDRSVVGADCSLAACLLQEDIGDFSQFHPNAWLRRWLAPSPVGLMDTKRLANDTLNPFAHSRTKTSCASGCTSSCCAIHWSTTGDESNCLDIPSATALRLSGAALCSVR